MKNYMLFIIFLSFFSCEEKKLEFIQSKPVGNLILLKNPPKDNALIKKSIHNFLLKNYSKYDDNKYPISFFKYTHNTRYFLNHSQDISGGFSDEKLDYYQDDEIGMFFISKCKNDTTKFVGILIFYGLKELKGEKDMDTLIYYCK